jgi:hypothetical protein
VEPPSNIFTVEVEDVNKIPDLEGTCELGGIAVTAA